MVAERVDTQPALEDYNSDTATSLDTMVADRVRTEPVLEDNNSENITTMETTKSERVITGAKLDTVEKRSLHKVRVHTSEENEHIRHLVQPVRKIASIRHCTRSTSA